MKITNKYNLPDALVKAVENREYSKGDATFSVTELLRPPQMWKLMKMYSDFIETDVIDNIWSVFGSAVHSILEKNTVDATAEKRIKINLGKYSLSGQMDRITDSEGNVIIQDYKVTSAYKILSNDIEDWSFQLNAYRFILETVGMKVSKMEIVAILRDWKRSDKIRNEKMGKPYPEAQVVIVPIQEDPDILLKIADRISILTKADKVSSIEELAKEFPCSVKDRWAKPGAYVVYNPKKDYVYRRFELPEETEEMHNMTRALAQEALNAMKNGEDYEVKYMPGESLRCEEYCLVSKFCFQRNGLKPEVVIPNNNSEDEVIEAIKNLGGANAIQ